MADFGPDRLVNQFGRYKVTAVRSGPLAGLYIVDNDSTYYAIFGNEPDATRVAFSRSQNEKE